MLLSDRLKYWRRFGLRQKPTKNTMAVLSILLGNYPDGRRELVAVKLGLFDTAGGRVQVVEGDLHEGDHVVVPSS